MARCIEILELNLRVTLDQLTVAAESERAVYARRLKHLSALLEYALEHS